MTIDLRPDGKSALATGSTAGIGLEIAKYLAAEGVRVTVVERLGCSHDLQSRRGPPPDQQKGVRSLPVSDGRPSPAARPCARLTPRG